MQIHTHMCTCTLQKTLSVSVFIYILGFGYMSLSVCVCVFSSVVYWCTSAYKYPGICVSACVDVRGRDQMCSSIVLGLIFAIEYITKPETH